MTVRDIDPMGGMPNGFDPRAASAKLSSRERSLVERRKRLLGPAYKLMYQHPVEFVRGAGVYLYDSESNAYLDCYNNVVSVGHCNPHVVQAVSQQLGTLNTHTRYMNDKILDYSERLLDTFPGQPLLSSGRVMYACTGSEANDLAVRMVKHVTGGTGMIVTDHAYHGTSELIAGLTPSLGAGVPLYRDVRLVPAPDPYRATHNVVVKFATDIECAIQDMQRSGIKFAGFLVDTMFSSDGVVTGPPGLLQAAAEVVHKHGGLLIADEVQAGFGRTGMTMWGFQRYEGLQPDLVTCGKPMGNGIPIAAVLARAEVADTFGRDVRYFNTFGGNPVSITAASATLDEVQRLMPQATQVSAYTLERLEQLKAKHTCIGDVRGAGQYFAVEFVRDRTSKEPDSEMASHVVNEMRERRVLLSTTSKAGNSLKIRPLLTFTNENADQFLSTLDASIQVASRKRENQDGSVLEAKFTPVTEDEAKSVLSTGFGLDATQIKRLDGERDDNFRVNTESGKRYMIKFVHPAEPPETTAFQSAILRHLQTVAPDLPVARIIDPVPTDTTSKDGQFVYQGRAVRVLTYMEGTLLASVERRTQVQSRNIGKVGAELCVALEGFSHPGQDHDLLWDIRQVSKMHKYLDAIEDSVERKVVEGLISNYETRVAPYIARNELATQVVHNDFNDANILVSPSAPDEVVGIIDWGDALRAPVVQDAAVGAVYALGSPDQDPDWLERSLAFLRGYDSVRPFTQIERDLMYDLVLARYALRLVIQTWRGIRFPENAAYIHRNTAGAWKELKALLALPDGRKTFASFTTSV